ncbi:MAG: ROK family protein [Burkholderiaceae bacterium]
MAGSDPVPSIGVDLGGTKIEAIVLDAQGSTRWRGRVPTPAGDYDATLAAIGALLQRAQSATGFAPDAPLGIGTPGSPTRAGRIKNANSTCLNGQALRDDLAELLHRPVRLANDADCLALSEASDGAGAGARVVFAVILGTGVGGGIVVDGRLLDGPNRTAGEWGHNPLPWADADDGHAPSCYCGQRGCVEAWLSGPALALDHFRRTGVALDPPHIAQGAAAGDVDCETSLQRYESRLARALAGVVNLLDPDVIVLGGGLSNLERLTTRVPALWSRHIFGATSSATSAEPVTTRLVRSRHGDSSGVRGAARLWQD